MRSIYFLSKNDDDDEVRDFADGTSESIKRVQYVGITDLSVHIETTDGRLYRITNGGDFLDGLRIEQESLT